MPLFLILVRVLLPSAAFAQQDNGNGRKQAHAVRVPGGSIDLDGRLDEAAWRDVPALTDFVQKEPIEGGPPTDRMEVRLAYDDTALYVGARMYSATPIQAPMGRRDSGDQAEHLLVSLDTYLDRRTSSTFGVTASGVRSCGSRSRNCGLPIEIRRSGASTSSGGCRRTTRKSTGR